ncbi:MAG: hypothetical protein IPH86_11975 [bacterium]|nr:hypothetical protein [bacterium]
MSPIGNPHTQAGHAPRASWYPYVLSFCSGMSIAAVELSASPRAWWPGVRYVDLRLDQHHRRDHDRAVDRLHGRRRLADRKGDLAPLLKLLLGACAWLLAMPFFGVPLLRGLAGALTGLDSSFSFVFVGSLLGILVLFAPPIVVMGMTSPFLVRELSRQGRVGASAGRIFRHLDHRQRARNVPARAGVHSPFWAPPGRS